MTIAAADLQSPLGEIDPALFYPALTTGAVTTRLTAYITAAATIITSSAITDAGIADELTRAYAYYRAWSDVVQRLTLTPASASLAGEVSTSFLQTQINEWLRGRDAWRTAFLALIPPATGISTAETLGISRAVETVVRF